MTRRGGQGSWSGGVAKIDARRPYTAVTLLVVSAVTAACSGATGGAARPASTLAPRPVAGESLTKVLPQVDTLSEMLGAPLVPNRVHASTVGDIDAIPNGLFSQPENSPRDCLGVLSEQQNSYRGANVQDYAGNMWQLLPNPLVAPAVLGVNTGAVALGTPTEADALFTEFTQRWSHCDGITVTVFADHDTVFATKKISEVGAVNSVLTATLQTIPTHGPPAIEKRAVGVRGNCLVEILVGYASNPDDSAEKIAHLMMDKVSELS